MLEPFFFHYTMALSFILFGMTDFAARLPSVFFGSLTIILAYLIGKEYSKSGEQKAAAGTTVTPVTNITTTGEENLILPSPTSTTGGQSPLIFVIIIAIVGLVAYLFLKGQKPWKGGKR